MAARRARLVVAPMNSNTQKDAPANEARRERYRQRFQRAQVIAAQRVRANAAGGAPNEAEAARLVAEFHARGGQVTHCPPAEDRPAEPWRGELATPG